MIGRTTASSVAVAWIVVALADGAVGGLPAQTRAGAPPPLRQSQLSRRLTRSDIEQAIALGTMGNPAPYLLYHRSGGPRSVSSAVVGVVYTPFLRVALAAHAADAAGRTLTPDDITAELTEPIVYVAFRWYGSFDPVLAPDAAAGFAAADFKIAMAGDRRERMMSGRLPPPPLRISRDVSLLRKFGIELPYRDIVLIAAYPADVIAPNVSLAIFKEWPSTKVPAGMDASIEEGLVTANDVANWR